MAALLVADDNVFQSIARHINGHDLGADARIIIHEMRDKFRIPALLSGIGFKPIEHCRGQRVHITVRTVGEVAFAGNDVQNAIAIHVREIDGMKLAKIHALGILLRLGSEDAVRGEGDLSICSLALIFKPEQTVAVGEFGAEDIVVAIAIEIIGEHLRAALGTECEGMERPFQSGIGGLLPPAIFLQQVEPFIAIHISKTKTVGEALASDLEAGNFLEGPLLRGILSVRRGKAKEAAAAANDFRLAITSEIAPSGRFIVQHGQHIVPCPGRILALGILKPVGDIPRKAEHEIIRPTVVVQVRGILHEILGVIIVRLNRLRMVNLMGLFPIWTFIPMRTINDVHLAIVVHVCGSGTLGVEGVGERLRGEADRWGG